MATTAKEFRNEVCLMVMLDSHGSQMETCCFGECSAWEWDPAGEEGEARRGHCALAGRIPASRDRKRRKT
jgi:hypothetical protein